MREEQQKEGEREVCHMLMESVESERALTLPLVSLY